MVTLFAATYPERTRTLVLFHPQEALEPDDETLREEFLHQLRERWGTQEFSDELLQGAARRCSATTTADGGSPITNASA